MHTNSSILLIGSGRLAQHLKYWNGLQQKPANILAWSRADKSDGLSHLLQEVSLVWLAISDSALVSFYEQHLINFKKPVVHFSGALSDSRMISAHPLMSFPKELLPNHVYPKIHFVLNGCENLKQALPQFNNNFSQIETGNKAFYHALCVLAGNIPQILWNDVLVEMKNLNIPVEAFDLYIQQISQNFISLKEKSITGPFVRKDYVTIEKNILSLSSHENLKNIYSTFAKGYSL